MGITHCLICGAEVEITGKCLTCRSCGWSACEVEQKETRKMLTIEEIAEIVEANGLEYALIEELQPELIRDKTLATLIKTIQDNIEELVDYLNLEL